MAKLQNQTTVQKPASIKAASKATTKKAEPKAKPAVKAKPEVKPAVVATVATVAPAVKPEVKAEAKKDRVFVIPTNAPTSGRYLFAYTSAVMSLVLSLPTKKQAAAAKFLHGASALRHHGQSGTGKMISKDNGAMSYDKGYFAVGPKSADEKRRQVPESWSKAFTHFFEKGEFPKGNPDGFMFKPAGKKTMTIKAD